MTKEGYTSNERIKEESDFLRGNISDLLHDDSITHFPSEEEFLLKFHGITQQDNRDERLIRKKNGQERNWLFMLRLRLPGGRMTPSQWLAAETLSDQFGNGTLKLTTRQAIQIHGVVKQDLKQTMKDIHHAAITTIAASGDATRNVMVSLHPEDSGIHETVFNQARELSRKLEPQTHAYHEIWLDAKRIYSGAEEEPLYGPGYLPRKFKIAFTLPPENDVDVYAQDLSFVAIEKEGKLLGYDILAGGGVGYAYGNPGSFPRLADIIGFCFPEQVEEVARQVLLIHKEFSTRCNRKTSRLRYTIAGKGLDWFTNELATRLPFPLQAARPFSLSTNGDAADVPGRQTIEIEGGRIQNSNRQQLKTAFHEIASIHQGDFFITGNQNLVIDGITPDTAEQIKSIIGKYNLLPNDSGLRRNSSACTSLPFCPQALTDSERLLPKLVDELEPQLKELGLWDEDISIRMTGCPNGCSRPYLAELAFVGRGPGKYNIWMGGSRRGDRLGFIYQESVPVKEIADVLRPVFARFAAERNQGEGFGDWSIRALHPQSL